MIVSPDHYLIDERDEYRWTVERVQEAWAKAREVVRSELPSAEKLVLMVGVPGSGKSTWLTAHADPKVAYFDATLTGDRARAEFVDLARSMGKEIEVVWMDTPIEVCLDRNAKRPSHRQVPETVIRSMHAKLDKYPPTLREGFAHITRVR